MNTDTTNGTPQAEHDPRALPPRQSWAELIADSNRKLAVMQRRCTEMQRKVGQLILERDEANATIARLEQEIDVLMQCIGWDTEAEEREIAASNPQVGKPPPF